MGERNCAVEGCNSLEFRNMGICNKHLHEGIEPIPAVMEVKKDNPYRNHIMKFMKDQGYEHEPIGEMDFVFK